MALNTMNGKVRKLTVPDYSDLQETSPGMTQRGELLVAQGLPLKSELVRQGCRWGTAVPVANAFQPVAAMPTTLANIVLYNGESSGGKCLIIDTVWAVTQTSIAAATSFAQLAQMGALGIAAPTDNTACKVRSGIGKVYSGLAKKAIANTAFAVAEYWECIGQSDGHPSTAIGAGIFSEVFGAYVVPPGQSFCVNLVASTAGGAMIQGISWFEVQLPVNV